jgi:RNA-binding protein
VGKEGLKDSVYAEIADQLKKNRLIKIRVLDNADSDTKNVADAIASQVGGVVVDVRGGVVVMTDKRTWTSLSQKKF